MRGDLQQAKKQKSRAESQVAGLEEELTHVKTTHRRSTSSRPATEETKKELQK